MSTFPTKELIVESILEGIKDAHENYAYWTNDAVWLNSAPEYMMNIFIGKHLAKHKRRSPSMSIWFEINIDDLTDSANPRDIKRFKKDITRNEEESEKNQKEKIDIVLDDLSESRVIIEVKNAVSAYGRRSRKDIIRICNAISHDSSLEYGIFAFYASDEADDMNAVILKIENAAKETIIEADKKGIIQFEKKVKLIEGNDNDGSCAAVCFILKRK